MEGGIMGIILGVLWMLSAAILLMVLLWRVFH